MFAYWPFFFRVPHTRGDEPQYPAELVENWCVFPTRVGMNQVMMKLSSFTASVPHTRGDEPVVLREALKGGLCSPHAWG